MLEATLRDHARRLLTASARSDVPPFMVMDVMAAAARIEAAGGHVIHMEVGQPAASAPKKGIAAAPAAPFSPVFPCGVGAGPPRRGAPPRHPAVPAHSDRARLRAGADRDLE